MTAPKLFISYSWTTPDHENWVLELATELRDSGIDVILDKWDLKEGQDAHAFMERMVTDSDISKVALICDECYVKKANSRSGGVGTEAQIITPELYTQQDEAKFVAVIRERDQDGKPFAPTYYGGRIYIDLSDASTYAENFERLVRWVYDEPLYKKPDLGHKPAFLTESENTLHFATSALFRRAIDAVKSGRDYLVPAVEEYFTALAAEMEKLRLVEGPDEPFDDAVVKSIEAFLPYRNEAIELFLTLAMYRDTDETRVAIHRLFEKLIPYLEPPPHVQQWKEWDFDNFIFLIHELFLYAIACYIKNERFDAAAYLMRNDYYVARHSELGRDTMVPYNVFRTYLKSLAHRNHRLVLRRLSVRADMLRERCKGLGVEFRHLMQADFVLYLRSVLHNSERMWWPETLVFAGRFSGAFEIFARSRSATYFERVRKLLDIKGKDDLQSFFVKLQKGEIQLPKWEFDSIEPAKLLGFEEIATKA
jgi:hypothetical protein